MRKRTSVGLVLFFVSMYIAYRWESLPGISEFIHGLLDPNIGQLFISNVWLGLVIFTGIVSLFLTLAQKYLTNQTELKELKKEQKKLNKKMKEFRSDPEKFEEIQKANAELVLPMLKHTFASIIWTSLPIILLFRWLGDILDPIFGGWWLLYYIVAAMIFSTIFRKVLDVA